MMSSLFSFVSNIFYLEQYRRMLSTRVFIFWVFVFPVIVWGVSQYYFDLVIKTKDYVKKPERAAIIMNLIHVALFLILFVFITRFVPTPFRISSIFEMKINAFVIIIMIFFVWAIVYVFFMDKCEPSLPWYLSPFVRLEKFVLYMYSYGAFFFPIVEEIVYRGFMFQALLQKFTPFEAILLQAFLFAILHANETLQMAKHTIGNSVNTSDFYNAVIANFSLRLNLGIMLGILAIYSQGLLLPIIVHMGSNALVIGYRCQNNILSI